MDRFKCWLCYSQMISLLDLFMENTYNRSLDTLLMPFMMMSMTLTSLMSKVAEAPGWD